MNNYIGIKAIIVSFAIIFLLISCKKFVEINPPKNKIVSEIVYTDNATATSVIRGIYSKMISSSGFGSGSSQSITFLTGLSSDELNNYSTFGDQVEFFTNSISKTNSTIQNSLWGEAYKYVNNANAIIEGLQLSSDVSDSIKQELIGEAKFVRAFCNFYLVNLFGDIPLIVTTDYRINASLSRTDKSQIYEQIINDLKDAQNILAPDYSFSGNERDQPNKWAATALLARVYLYTGDYVNAEAQSTSVINNTALYDTVPLNNVFLKNSKEAIWQLKPVQTTLNTNEGGNFILTSAPGSGASGTVTLTSQLFNAFESGDNRKIAWIGSIKVGNITYYFPYKYKIKSGGIPLNEYSMVLRLSEQYLIRAEARALQNKIVDAQADLNIIRKRAGLPNTSAGAQTELLDAILHERQVELFTEWGHRWFDLKRLGKADAVLGTIKGSNWQTADVLYPIPQSEILVDPNLTQNFGY